MTGPLFIGSIIDPAARASVIGLKPSIHRIPNDGVIPLSFSQDVVRKNF